MESKESQPFGYLLVHFIEDPNAYAERIYLDLSDGDNPEHWNPLNGGKPILTSPLGTRGVRDPYLVRNPQTGKVYILATDLMVFSDGHGSDSGADWYKFSHHGSTNLIIWESDDLVHWSAPRMLDMSKRADGTHAQLGMAWAPGHCGCPTIIRKAMRAVVELSWCIGQAPCSPMMMSTTRIPTCTTGSCGA